MNPNRMNPNAVTRNAVNRNPVNPMRATVADIAYGELVVGGGGAVDIGALTSGIDAADVVVEGRRIHTVEAWSRLFARTLAGLGVVTLTYPSTWGRRRVEILRRAAQPHCTGLQVVPRAVAIARSHLDTAAQRILVIEVHDRIDVHQLRRSGGDWQISSTRVLTDPDGLPGVLAAVVDNRVEAILVDGRDRAAVERVRRSAEDATVVGRVLAVQRALLHGYGGTELTPTPVDDHPPDSPRSRGRYAAVAAAALLIVVAAVAVGVAVLRDGSSAAPAAQIDRSVQLGRVSVTVPQHWRQSSEPPAEGVISRTTFAAPDDDSRLIVLQNTVRDTSTLASVGVSLRNRIGQRGDEVVQEFSSNTRYAGREVISYREVPVSGGAIRWYLTVSGGLQVSIGCQDGSAGASIDRQCRTAVGSLGISAG